MFQLSYNWELHRLVFRWEINKFENCWHKSVRILKVLELLFQQFLNLSSSQRDRIGSILRTLSNNRWSGGTAPLWITSRNTTRIMLGCGIVSNLWVVTPRVHTCNKQGTIPRVDVTRRSLKNIIKLRKLSSRHPFTCLALLLISDWFTVDLFELRHGTGTWQIRAAEQARRKKNERKEKETELEHEVKSCDITFRCWWKWQNIYLFIRFSFKFLPLCSRACRPAQDGLGFSSSQRGLRCDDSFLCSSFPSLNSLSIMNHRCEDDRFLVFASLRDIFKPRLVSQKWNGCQSWNTKLKKKILIWLSLMSESHWWYLFHKKKK
jgi:hypothetical protein